MTEKHIGRRVVVIGAGIGGLAVAGALADLFDEVVVLERDPLPSNASPRPGVPQGRHLHGLLGGGLEALCKLFPDLECKLSAAGAVAIHVNSEFCEEIGGSEKQRRDFGWNGSMQSRPLLELVIRKALDQHPNVTLRSGCRVLALSSTVDGARVTGVRYPSSDGGTEALEADLVVDASGRGALTTSLLQALDRPRPREIEIGVDLGYATALFAIPADAPKEWLAVLTHADAPHSSRAGVINPVEGNLWIVTLIGRGAEQPPTDLTGFQAFAQSLSTKTIYNAIKSAELIDDISRFVFPASTRRYFDLATLPDRLIVMGDALCRFNPMYGQGMSVAACEAVRLRELLRAHRGKRSPLAGLGRLFQTEAQAIIEGPWQMSAIPDFIYPNTRGQRPDDFAQTLAYAGALHRLALRDPAIDK
jgi:2-polyprenyl-6-methoxyphenol hydroxylase-like FAD-dependent oxidoreductase